MPKKRSVKLEVLTIVISLAVVAIPAIDQLGKPVRMVLILTIIAGSMAVGVSLGRLVERIRREKEEKTLEERV